MIVNTSIQNSESLGNIEQNSVTIDPKNIQHIIQILSSNLYSNPIRSFLRETVSNAYDSHVEAHSTEPIIVTITSDYVAIRDFGTGISPERFKEIYLCIGSSTKRESNDYLGYFGIGRFSALACSDIVNITNFYDGKKYCYVMIKDNNSLRIDSLGTFDTEEANGVDVRIPISYPSSYINELDVLDFFPNIYINTTFESQFNSRKVTEYKTFKFSTYNAYNFNKKPSLLIGNVMYNLDLSYFQYDKGFQDILKRISIQSEIGKVDITPNREQIIYSKPTIEYIQSLLDNTIKEITEIADLQSRSSYDSLLELKKNFNVSLSVILGVDNVFTLYGKYKGGYYYKNEFHSIKDLRGLFLLLNNSVKVFCNGVCRRKERPITDFISRNTFRLPYSCPKNSKDLKKYIKENYGGYIVIQSPSLKEIKHWIQALLDYGVKWKLIKDLLREVNKKIPEIDIYNSEEFKEFKADLAKERKENKKKNFTGLFPISIETKQYLLYYMEERKRTIYTKEALQELTRGKKIIWYYKGCEEKKEIAEFLYAMQNKKILAIGIAKTLLKTFTVPENWIPYDEYILNNKKFWKIVSFYATITNVEEKACLLKKVQPYLNIKEAETIDEFMRYIKHRRPECMLMTNRVINSRGIHPEIVSFISELEKLIEKIKKGNALINLAGMNALTAFVCMKKKYFNINYSTYKSIKEL